MLRRNSIFRSSAKQSESRAVIDHANINQVEIVNLEQQIIAKSLEPIFIFSVRIHYKTGAVKSAELTDDDIFKYWEFISEADKKKYLIDEKSAKHCCAIL